MKLKDTMSDMIAVKRVVLAGHHLRPGRTNHFIKDEKGRREFPPFTSLAITHYPENAGYWLMHICENGQGTDTFHLTLDDALHQAEWEFDVRPDEWADTNEKF